MACSLLLGIFAALKRQGVSVSQAIAAIATYANSGEVNFKLDDKQGAMEALRAHFTAQEEPTAFYDFDGYRIEFKDWWFNVRPSNTEPYLRLIMEASSRKLLDEKLAVAKGIIEKCRA